MADYGTANFMQQTMTVAPGAMVYCAPEALTSNQTVKVSFLDSTLFHQHVLDLEETRWCIDLERWLVVYSQKRNCTTDYVLLHLGVKLKAAN